MVKQYYGCLAAIFTDFATWRINPSLPVGSSKDPALRHSKQALVQVLVRSIELAEGSKVQELGQPHNKVQVQAHSKVQVQAHSKVQVQAHSKVQARSKGQGNKGLLSSYSQRAAHQPNWQPSTC